MPYQPRIIDSELRELLGIIGAVVIEGPRASGKTETARQAAGSEVLLDIDEQAREALRINPARVLSGPTPRLIDEWQLVPAVWNHIRRAVDDRRKPGQFILTGSAIPADDATRHSGAGRMIRLRMRPMTLFETEHSDGAISLKRLLDGDIAGTSPPSLDIDGLADRIVIGGWPRVLGLDAGSATRIVRGYVDEISRVGLPGLGETRRDPVRLNRLLMALSRNVATYASLSTLMADTQGPDGILDAETVREYLSMLERLMIVEDQPPWGPSLRSRSRLRGTPKRHFADPSLAAAALSLTPSRLLDDLQLMGFLFESLAIRDLRVYAQVADARVFQYRDSTGLEVDAIVECRDGRWAAFEVKLGPGQADTAANSLLRLAERVDTDRIGKPAMLGVITGFGYGYMRRDGVAVIPIGALGP